jgi:hypothetical protein
MFTLTLKPGGKGGLADRMGRGCSAGPSVWRLAALTGGGRERSGGQGPAACSDPPILWLPSISVNISVTGSEYPGDN